MGEQHLDKDPADTGVSRRDAVKKVAIAGGALVWATPVVQSIGMSSALAQGPTPVCDCTGATSFDVRAVLTGIVAGTAGPIQNFPDENGCLVGPLTVSLPGTGNFVTAAVDCVSGSTTGGSCTSGVRLTDVRVDLAQINPAFDIQVGAGVVESTATCSCPDGCQASTCVIPGPNDPPILVIGGTPIVPSSLLCNANIVIQIPLGPLVVGTIELLTTSSNPCEATFLHINVALLAVPGGAPLQTVDLVVARATAVCS